MRSVRLASVDFRVARLSRATKRQKCGSVDIGDVYEPDTTPSL